MRSYYDLMNKSEVKAEDGTYYPDVFTLPTNEFTFESIPTEQVLTSNDLIRPDILVANAYGSSDYYDIVFDINEVGFVKNKTPGDTILLPTLQEIDRFYLRNSK